MSVPFRQDVFGGSSVVIVEAAFGANINASPSGWTWTDVSADVMYNAGLNGTWGRADETSQSTPAQMTFSLINLSGAYSAYAAGIGFNSKATPIRVSRNLGAGAVVEFQGRSVGFTPTWDTTGKVPIVNVVAAGTLRRLGQPKAPTRSPLYRAIEKLSGLVEHWPMEEAGGPNSENIKSGGSSLHVVSGSATWGQVTPPAGASAAVNLAAGSLMTASCAYTGTGFFQVGIGWQTTATAPGACKELLRFKLSGGYTIWIAISDLLSGALGNRGVHVQLTSNDNITLVEGLIDATNINTMDGNWHYLVASFQPHGSGFDAFLWVDGVSFGGVAFTSPAVTLGDITQINLGHTDINLFVDTNDGDIALSHLYVQTASVDSKVGQAAAAWAGETADARLLRVAAEEGMSLAIAGSSNITMGPQPIDTPLAIYRDCEKSDGGVLYDGFDDGLRYICRSARYNISASLTIDAGSGGQLAPPFAPVDDDQRLVNQFAASRSNGGTVTLSDTTSPLNTSAIGIYAQSDTFSLADDTFLQGIAGWRINLGTVNGLRYPTLGIDFVSAGGSTLAANWMTAVNSQRPISFRVDVTNVSTSATNHPPGTLLLIVEGYSITSNTKSWTVTANCVAYSPNRGFTISSATQGRVDAANTTTNATLTTTQTGSCSMTVGSFPWTTTATFPADFPLDVVIKGEQITVSAIAAPSGGTQAFTISARSVNGVVISHAAGEKVTVWQPGKVLL